MSLEPSDYPISSQHQQGGQTHSQQADPDESQYRHNVPLLLSLKNRPTDISHDYHDGETC